MTTPQSGVPLPDRERKYLRIVWARAGTVERAYSFSPAVVGRWMHWVDGRTQLCLSPDTECAWCRARVGHRWYGWLYGRSIDHDCPCLIQLPAETVRLTLQLRDPGIILTGAHITLQRDAGARNSCVRAIVRLDALRGTAPLQEPDVLGHLKRFYGLDRYPEGRHSMSPEDDA